VSDGRPHENRLKVNMSGSPQAPGCFKAFCPSSAHVRPEAVSFPDGVRRKQMSTHFRFPLNTFVRHDDLNFFSAKECNKPAVISPAPLRNGHIILLAVDALVVLHASFNKWRNYRRTLRALADLDEHQLRDIGLTREDTLPGLQSYRALADLNEVRRHSPEETQTKRRTMADARSLQA
jgi:hypothetical protein